MATDNKSVLLRSAEYMSQLHECDALIRQYQPAGVHWHRPGGGFFSRRTLRLAAKMGYKTVSTHTRTHAHTHVWHASAFSRVHTELRALSRSRWCVGAVQVLGSVYPHDPQITLSSLNAWHLKARSRPGAIVIIHDRSHTPSTLRKALPTLSERLRFVTISQLLKQPTQVRQERAMHGRPCTTTRRRVSQGSAVVGAMAVGVDIEPHHTPSQRHESDDDKHAPSTTSTTATPRPAQSSLSAAHPESPLII